MNTPHKTFTHHCTNSSLYPTYDDYINSLFQSHADCAENISNPRNLKGYVFAKNSLKKQRNFDEEDSNVSLDKLKVNLKRNFNALQNKFQRLRTLFEPNNSTCNYHVNNNFINNFPKYSFTSFFSQIPAESPREYREPIIRIQLKKNFNTSERIHDSDSSEEPSVKYECSKKKTNYSIFNKNKPQAKITSNSFRNCDMRHEKVDWFQLVGNVTGNGNVNENGSPANEHKRRRKSKRSNSSSLSCNLSQIAIDIVNDRERTECKKISQSCIVPKMTSSLVQIRENELMFAKTTHDCDLNKFNGGDFKTNQEKEKDKQDIAMTEEQIDEDEEALRIIMEIDKKSKSEAMLMKLQHGIDQCNNSKTANDNEKKEIDKPKPKPKPKPNLLQTMIDNSTDKLITVSTQRNGSCVSFDQNNQVIISYIETDCIEKLTIINENGQSNIMKPRNYSKYYMLLKSNYRPKSIMKHGKKKPMKKLVPGIIERNKKLIKDMEKKKKTGVTIRDMTPMRTKKKEPETETETETLKPTLQKSRNVGKNIPKLDNLRRNVPNKNDGCITRKANTSRK